MKRGKDGCNRCVGEGEVAGAQSQTACPIVTSAGKTLEHAYLHLSRAIVTVTTKLHVCHELRIQHLLSTVLNQPLSCWLVFLGTYVTRC